MAEESTAIDPLDRVILGELIEDGRVTWRDLGDRVGLSPNAVAERVHRLERVGVISGYRAVVDPIALGRHLEAFVAVKMYPGDDRERISAYVRANDAVIDAVHLTGPHDYYLHVLCRETSELDELLMFLKREVGVADTETRVVLHRLPTI